MLHRFKTVGCFRNKTLTNGGRERKIGMSGTESDSFKRLIDLRAYAAVQGYQEDRRNSYAGSTCMRHPATDDKVFIKRDADGHYVYFSVRDDRDNGSIVDFIMKKKGWGWGAIFGELRDWMGAPPSSLPVFSPLPSTPKNRMHVEAVYACMTEVTAHPYLENERGLPAGLLASERFAGRVRMDDTPYKNVIFPHFDLNGLCGYEIKNRGFTGFARGGEKGLWMSHTRDDDNRLVFCESAIDALSHAVLFPDDQARYASIGGKPNPQQPELIRAAVARMRDGAEIVAAMDNDADGAVLAGVVEKAVKLSGRNDLRFTVHEPFGFKDWNDQLRRKPESSLPYCPGGPKLAS